MTVSALAATGITPFQQVRAHVDHKLGPEAAFIFRPHGDTGNHIFVMNKRVHRLNLTGLNNLPAGVTNRLNGDLLRLEGPADGLLNVVEALCS